MNEQPVRRTRWARLVAAPMLCSRTEENPPLDSDLAIPNNMRMTHATVHLRVAPLGNGQSARIAGARHAFRRATQVLQAANAGDKPATVTISLSESSDGVAARAVAQAVSIVSTDFPSVIADITA